MFDSTLSIKGFGGVGDTTGTAVTFNRLSSNGKSVRYGLSTNTSSDSTFLDIRYSESPRRARSRRGDDGLMRNYVSSVRKFLVKVSRVTYNVDMLSYVTSTVNFTCEYDSALQSHDATAIKNLMGYAANCVGVTANTTKLLAMEA